MFDALTRVLGFVPMVRGRVGGCGGWASLLVVPGFGLRCLLRGLGARGGLGARLWLVDHGAWELSAVGLVWYLLQGGLGWRALVVVVSAARCTPSVDCLFRNARWLEREVGEMHDWFYGGKRDRRALFLLPLLYWAPLRRAFPTGGFYEVRLHPEDGRLAALHVSWLD